MSMVRSVLIILVATSYASASKGQDPGASIVFDGSLGGEAGSAPSAIDPESGLLVYEIADERGKYSGANLFHSFERFGILSNEGAQFTADLGTPERIIARVTGQSKSEIDGRLSSSVMFERNGEQQAADIYLVNPYGISIGGKAVVDVPGSLYLSTAHAIRFEGGPDFHTHGMGGDVHAMGTLLSAEPPVAFGFSDPQVFGLSDEQAADFGRIQIERTSIAPGGAPKIVVDPGTTLTLVGADSPSGEPGVYMERFNLPGEDPAATTEIQARGARVQLASAGGVVDIPVDLRDLDPEQIHAQDLGHVSINNFFSIDAGDLDHGSNSGEIVIRGGRFTLERFATTSAGLLDVDVSDDILIAGGAEVGAREIAMGGTSITITDLRSDTEPKPGAIVKSGSVALRADEIEVSGDGAIEVNSRLAAEGLLEIDADVVRVERGGILRSVAENFEAGGDIEISADERLIVSGSSCPSATECGRSAITARSAEDLGGDAGEIRIEAPIVEVVDGGVIEVFDSFGGGETDGIAILASDRVTVARGSEAEGASVVSTDSEGDGTAGDLRIARLDHFDGLRVELHDGGQLSASTSGTAAAGSVEIDADIVEVTGSFYNPSNDSVTESGIFSQSTLVHTDDGPVGGPGGNVWVTARRLMIGDRGRIGVGTRGGGDAGTILLEIDEHLVVSGPVNEGDLGNIEASNRVVGAPGQPGDIVILVEGPDGSVVLRDGAVITAQSLGSADAGNIFIAAGGRFEATGFSVNKDRVVTRSGVTTESLSSSGGQIVIGASELVYLFNGEIRTSVQGGEGGGGDVAIGSSESGIPEFAAYDERLRTPRFAVLNEGRVVASAVEGPGGNIDIATGTFFASAPFAIDPGPPIPERGSFLDASSGSDLNGTVNVDPPEAELVTELASLSTAFLDASALLASACEARTSRAGSFQVVKRRAADLAAPDAALDPGALGGSAPRIGVDPANSDLCASPEES